jgi:hypothetical protein
MAPAPRRANGPPGVDAGAPDRRLLCSVGLQALAERAGRIFVENLNQWPSLPPLPLAYYALSELDVLTLKFLNLKFLNLNFASKTSS